MVLAHGNLAKMLIFILLYLQPSFNKNMHLHNLIYSPLILIYFYHLLLILFLQYVRNLNFHLCSLSSFQSGPHRLSRIGSSTNACSIPNTIMQNHCLKKAQKTQLEAADIIMIERKVDIAPCTIDDPISLNAFYTLDFLRSRFV